MSQILSRISNTGITYSSGNIDELTLNSGSIYFNQTTQNSYLASNTSSYFPSIGTGPFTVEFWARMTDPGVFNNNLITTQFIDLVNSSGTTGSESLLIQRNVTSLNPFTATLQVYINNSIFLSSSNISNTVISYNKWFHVAVARDSSNNLRAFIDGNNVISTTNSSNIITNALSIGSGFNSAAGSNFVQYTGLTGYMSNIRVIVGTALYTSNFTPPKNILNSISGTAILIDNTAKNYDDSGSYNVILGTPYQGSIGSNQNLLKLSNLSPFRSDDLKGSILLNGTTDYILTSANTVSGTTDFSYECFFYLTSNLTYLTADGFYSARLISGNQTDSTELILHNIFLSNNVPGGIALNAYGNTTTFSLSASFISNPITINNWHHVAVAKTSNNYAIFLDGILVTSTNFSFSFANSSLYVGGENTGSLTGYNAYFPGYISNVRVLTGSSAYDPTQTTITVPSTTLPYIANTTLLLNFANTANIISDSASGKTVTLAGTANSSYFSPFNSPIVARTDVSGNFLVGNIFDETSLSQIAANNIVQRIAPDSTVYTYNEFDEITFNSGSIAVNSSYISVPSNASFNIGSNNFTIDGWIFANTTNVTDGTIIEKVPTGSTITAGYWVIHLNTSRSIAFICGDKSVGAVDYMTSNTTITSNTWYHFALTRNGANNFLYINGILANTLVAANITPTVAYGINIGGDLAASVNGTNFFPGYLSNIRFVNGTALYTSNFTPPKNISTAVSNTVLLLNCLDSNRAFVDNSILNSNLTVTGNSYFFPFNPFQSYNTGSTFFGGLQDYLIGPSNTVYQVNSAFTAECYIFPLNNSSVSGMTNRGIIGYHNITAATAGTGGWILNLSSSSNGQIVFTTFNGSNTFTTGLTSGNQRVSAKAWSHIAMTYDGASNYSLYVNGVLANTVSSIGTVSYGGATFNVGRWNDASSYRTFNGYITGVRFVKGTSLYSGNSFIPPTVINNVANTVLLLNMSTNSTFDSSSTNALFVANNLPVYIPNSF